MAEAVRSGLQAGAAARRRSRAFALTLGLGLCLLAAAAHADLASDVKRAYRHDDAERRVAGLRSARAGIAGADRKRRDRAAAQIEKSLKKEAAPSVRNASLDFLLALRTERSLDRLVVGAVDRHPDVVAHTHALVRDHADPALHKAIVRAMKEDASWRLRAAMVDLLLSGARENARRPLLDALGDAHPGVVARAAEALYRLTGSAYGADAEKWRAHFATEKQQAEEREVERRTVAGEARKVTIKEGPVRGLTPRLYTIPIVRKRVLFVVDMSSSMNKTARSSHFTELKRALFGLPSDVHFNVLCFDQRLFFFTGAARAKELVPATTPNKAKCERWINDLPAGERTDVNRSVLTGLAMLREALRADPASKAELFILTDGRETAKTTSLQALQAQYARLPAGRCQIHVISLGKQGTPLLKALAERSGGRFVDAPGR